MRSITVVLAALAIGLLSYGVSLAPAAALQADNTAVFSESAPLPTRLLLVRRSGVKRGDCTVYCSRWEWTEARCPTCRRWRYCAQYLSYCPGRHY
jgi:hypothetical protein